MKILRRVLEILTVVVLVFYGYYRVQIAGKADVTAPVISVDGSGELSLSVNAAEEEYFAGLRAVDDIDGDVTDSIVMVSRSGFVEKGKLKVNFAAFDSSNNVGTFSRMVDYIDYVSPEFHMSEPMNRSYARNQNSDLDGVSVSDVLDGEISQNIKEIQDSGSDDASGDTQTLQVTNSAGDTVSLTVFVHRALSDEYAQTCPWLSDYVFYMNAGESQPDYAASFKGTWLNGSGREFRTDEVPVTDWEYLNRFDTGDWNLLNSLGQGYFVNNSQTRYYAVFNTDNINPEMPGAYTGTVTLYGDNRKLGSADFYVVVREGQS